MIQDQGGLSEMWKCLPRARGANSRTLPRRSPAPSARPGTATRLRSRRRLSMPRTPGARLLRCSGRMCIECDGSTGNNGRRIVWGVSLLETGRPIGSTKLRPSDTTGGGVCCRTEALASLLVRSKLTWSRRFVTLNCNGGLSCRGVLLTLTVVLSSSAL